MLVLVLYLFQYRVIQLQLVVEVVVRDLLQEQVIQDLIQFFQQ